MDLLLKPDISAIPSMDVVRCVPERNKEVACSMRNLLRYVGKGTFNCLLKQVVTRLCGMFKACEMSCKENCVLT